MLARIFSTILLWAATLLAIALFDSLGWAVLIALLSAASLREALCIMRKMGLSPSGKIAQCSSAAIIACAFFGMTLGCSLGGAMAFAFCAPRPHASWYATRAATSSKRRSCPLSPQSAQYPLCSTGS